MGVPAFYRWISEKYPKIVINMLEARSKMINGMVFPLDLNDPNPNEIEYDNLYIDMNGLIHPCSHPEDREAPTTEEEMYVNVCKYLDRLIAAIRPRKLLYLAIDGVAPRAKMNQQRSRRFRSAQEAKEKKELLQEVIKDMADMGLEPPEHMQGQQDGWDSNVITPGTDFMFKISDFIKHYILQRMNGGTSAVGSTTASYWRNITVIFSDASEPGEGEHKIMSFIRSQRLQAGYEGTCHHVIHGLDADLIMLALATHEVKFTILREKVFFGKKKGKGEDEEEDVDPRQRLLDGQSDASRGIAPEDTWLYNKPLQALQVHTLRAYLHYEFLCLGSGFDLERVIDDFLFLCFFVGNDFLPHLPSLDIRDGALDFLIMVYKDLRMNGSLSDYLTSAGGRVNLRQVDVLVQQIGHLEDLIFMRKKAMEDKNEEKMAMRRGGDGGGRGGGGGDRGGGGQQHRQQVQQLLQQLPPPPPVLQIPTAATTSAPPPAMTTAEVKAGNMDAAMKLKQQLLGKRSRSVQPDNSSSEAIAHAATVAAEAMEEAKNNGGEAEDKDDETAPAPSKRSKKNRDKEDEADDPEEEAEQVTGEEGGGEGGGWDSDEEEALEEVLDEIIQLPATVTKAATAKQLSLEELEKVQEEIKQRVKAKESSKIDGYKTSIQDSVRFHERGWKDRYYAEPFKQQDIVEGGGLLKMVYSYVQGLCWVMQYYYRGVPSWEWYYPFHYAPFASDLANMERYVDLATGRRKEIVFQQAIALAASSDNDSKPQISSQLIIDRFLLACPFSPLEQLLAVLPASSHAALPAEIQYLMLDGQRSPIHDLYSIEDHLIIDPNGKHLPWLWIVLLPFIDERRIQAAYQAAKKELSLISRVKNGLGKSVIFGYIGQGPQLTAAANNRSAMTTTRRINTATMGALALSSYPQLLDLIYENSAQPETNVEVIAWYREHSLPLPHSSNNNNSNSCNSTIGNEPLLSFDGGMLDGLSLAGRVGPPIHRFHTPLHMQVMKPLNTEHLQGFFVDIEVNQVMVLEYQLPVESQEHSSIVASSQLLPSVAHMSLDDLAQPWPMTSFEKNGIGMKRPPRLNRSGFSVLDLYAQNKQHQQGGGYNRQGSYGQGQGGQQQGYSQQGQYQQQYNQQQYGNNNQQGHHGRGYQHGNNNNNYHDSNSSNSGHISYQQQQQQQHMNLPYRQPHQQQQQQQQGYQPQRSLQHSVQQSFGYQQQQQQGGRGGGGGRGYQPPPRPPSFLFNNTTPTNNQQATAAGGGRGGAGYSFRHPSSAAAANPLQQQQPAAAIQFSQQEQYQPQIQRIRPQPGSQQQPPLGGGGIGHSYNAARRGGLGGIGAAAASLRTIPPISPHAVQPAVRGNMVMNQQQQQPSSTSAASLEQMRLQMLKTLQQVNRTPGGVGSQPQQQQQHGRPPY